MTHTLAHELKQAGFPQPKPKAGQFWCGKRNAGFISEAGSLCILIGTKTGNLQFKAIDGQANENNRFFVFAPSLDDITPLLPPSFALEYWDGKPSCTNRDNENPLRTFGDTFAEAAARMWLEIIKAPL